MNAPAHPVLSQEEAFARIRLLRSPNVGPVSYAMLLRRPFFKFRSLTQILALILGGGALFLLLHLFA